MADKTVLDFQVLTDTQNGDIIYVIRGTGVNRDKQQTKVNFLQDFYDLVTKTLFVDTITEKTSSNGVLIDGVLIKDNDVNADDITVINVNADDVNADNVIVTNVNTSTINVDTITEKTSSNGVLIDGVLIKDNDITADDIIVTNVNTSTINVDTITEKTSSNGVLIDGVLIKDNDVNADNVNTDTINVDTITEKTTNNGVDVDGITIKDGIVRTDDIIEKNFAAGVTIEQSLLRDGYIEAANYVWDLFWKRESSVTTEPYLGSGSLYEFSSPAVNSNTGLLVDIKGASRETSGFGKIFSNRNCYYFDGSQRYVHLLDQLQNEDSLEFWIFPNWGSSPANDHTIIDSREGAGNSNNAFLFYDKISNKYVFYMTSIDFATDRLTILSSVIATPNLKTHIKIAWSKSGNTSKMFINGVDQGSPSVTGTGIASLNMSAVSGLAIGIRTLLPDAGENANEPMNAWFTDLLIHGSYDITTAHYSLNKPYVTTNRQMGKNTNGWLDDNGNIGAKTLSADSIDYGCGQVKTTRLQIGGWDMDTDGIQSVLTGIDFDKIISVCVIIYDDNRVLLYDLFAGGYYRMSATQIDLIRNAGGVFDTTTFDDDTFNRGWVYITHYI